MEAVIEMITDALVIGIGRLLAVLPIIGIGLLVHLYRPIVVYTVGEHKFLFVVPKVKKHESGFRFR